MTLTIGGFTHTNALLEGTMSIRYYGTLRSSFRATLHFSNIPIHFPKVGQEILVSEGNNVIWGGILVEAEEVCHSTKSFTMTLRGQGYEQILQRFCLPGITLPEYSPSEAAQYIFQNYLNPADGLILGAIDTGLTQKYAYSFHPAKASSIFDRLAAENGFVWWVDKSKTFHMQARLPQTEQTLCIDLTRGKANRLEDIQTLVYRSSTAEYKNMQYVYNRSTDIEGNYFNINRLQEMSGRFGSGEYGASASNSVVTNQTAAQSVAQQILTGSPGIGEIEFTTDNDAFIPGQILGVTAPVCGIKTETQFCVTEVCAVYFYNRFRYTITAKETDSGPITTAAWESILAGGSTN